MTVLGMPINPQEYEDLFSVIDDALATEESGYCISPSATEFDFRCGHCKGLKKTADGICSLCGKFPALHCPTTRKKYYWDWEKEIAMPALAAKGFVVFGVHTGDGDSFGPLTRWFSVSKDGPRRKTNLRIGAPMPIVGCVNVLHNAVDCPTAQLPRDEWCEVCRTVPSNANEYLERMQAVRDVYGPPDVFTVRPTTFREIDPVAAHRFLKEIK